MALEGKSGTPGSGRYTTYTPLETESKNRYEKRLAMFNNKAPAEKGLIYVGDTPAARAQKVVERAVSAYEQIDKGIFPGGADEVNKSFGGAPDITKVTWASAGGAGGPANPYAPDITSPGPGKALGTDKSTNPNLSILDFNRPNAATAANTASPSTVSAANGTLPIGTSLIGGKPGVPGSSKAPESGDVNIVTLDEPASPPQ